MPSTAAKHWSFPVRAEQVMRSARFGKRIPFWFGSWWWTPRMWIPSWRHLSAVWSKGYQLRLQWIPSQPSGKDTPFAMIKWYDQSHSQSTGGEPGSPLVCLRLRLRKEDTTLIYIFFAPDLKRLRQLPPWISCAGPNWKCSRWGGRQNGKGSTALRCFAMWQTPKSV